MPNRGVLYIVWDNNPKIAKSLQRSITSVQEYHRELPIHVEHLCDNATFLDKARMLDLSPFDETLFLDADTVVLDRLDFAFEKAISFGLACAICECPWARRYDDTKLCGDIVEYNTGVLFFTKKVKPLFDIWHQLACEVKSSITHYKDGRIKKMMLADQGSFALAVEKTAFSPFVLPLNWNLRPQWHKSFFGPIKIWHDHCEVLPDILEWNKNQCLEDHTIQYAELNVKVVYD